MQDDDLVTAFEQGGVDGADFPHERHVRVCWGLAQRYERGEALRRLIAGISAMAARAGRPEAYHETITRAWFELIAGAEDLGHSPELFDKTLLGRYYSPARLAAGRERWLEPDLHPLRLPAPAPSSAGDDLPAVMRQIPTAVAVLATRLEHTVHATTVSSFTSADEHMGRAVPVELDRQPGGTHAKRVEEFVLGRVRLPRRHLLLHPPEGDSIALAVQADRYEAGASLQRHRLGAERGGDHECRSQHGVAGERQLIARCEDPHRHVAAISRREKEPRDGPFV